MMMNWIGKASCALLLLLWAQQAAIAQDSGGELYDMSLEELMNIEIVSASKKVESVFEAPLSSYTVSKDEIRYSGATSIPEALRLAPNLIVREQANGVYDIHMRGFDNVPRFTDGIFQPNAITLVMIDNRPVFSHNMGGTYWETLPIDLNDVERIEIVSGPSAPLFGPNAVAGVINIITKNTTREGLNASANVQYGNHNSLIAGVRVGQNMGKLDVGASANIEQRDRFVTDYYQYTGDVFVEDAQNLVDKFGQPIPDVATSLPQPEMALDRHGVNFFANYTAQDNVKFGIQAGLQESEIQKSLFSNDFTPFSFSTSESKYVNLTADVKGVNARYSYTTNSDNLTSFVTVVPFQYDMNVSDLFIDYTWNISNKLSLQPGFNYQHSTLSGSQYVKEGQVDPLKGERSLQTIAGSLRLDYALTDAWRVIAAARLDKFTQPDKNYLSYQFASTYRLGDSNLLRAVVSRSNSGSFVGPTYLDVEIVYPVGQLPITGINKTTGNTNLDLFRLDMYELGYRSKLSERVELNVEVFHQRAENFYSAVVQAVPPPHIQQFSLVAAIENLPVSAAQTGVTLSANMVTKSNFQFKPFVTFQRTAVSDLPLKLRSPEADPVENTETTFDTENHSTPTWYGGGYFNYRLGKWSIGLNPYFMSSYRIFNGAENGYTTDVGKIDGRFILNAKVNYRVLDNLSVYVNARNLGNSTGRQYFGTDELRTLILGGVSFNLGF